MRYLLIVLGLIFSIMGFSAVAIRDNMGPAIFLGGVIFFTFGSVTCDIVNALQPKPEIPDTDENPES
jgi:hypothetical protein